MGRPRQHMLEALVRQDRAQVAGIQHREGDLAAGAGLGPAKRSIRVVRHGAAPREREALFPLDRPYRGDAVVA